MVIKDQMAQMAPEEHQETRDHPYVLYLHSLCTEIITITFRVRLER